jgi:hypothetical protein
MGFFGGMAKGLQTSRENARNARADQLEQAKSMAALQEAGYNYDPQANTLSRSEQFGAVPAGYERFGGKLVEKKDYIDPVEESTISKNQAATKLYESKAGQGPTLTPGRQMAKDKMTQKIFETVEGNKPKFGAIEAAEKSLPKVPQGFIGGLKVKWMQNFDPQNPTLTDWQKLKTVLTDAQLMNTAKTKGAISDQEMKLFAKAAANDDIMSVARMTPAIQRVKAALSAEQEGMFGGFKKSYGEDPKEWFDQEGGDVPEFASEQEAEASGVKGDVIIAGRPARIE